MTGPVGVAAPDMAVRDLAGHHDGEASPDRGPERDAWAVLAAIDGMGPVAFAALLARFGSGRAILAEAARPGAAARLAATPALEVERPPHEHATRRPVGDVTAQSIANGVQRGPRVLERIAQLGIAVVTLDDPAYPPPLAQVAMPPHVLFVTGDVAVLSKRPSIAVVGTRRASSTGRVTAARIAQALVAVDALVVSGLAYGIDGVAHEATIRSGGTTVAVIGSGHACLSPRPHQRLAEAILAAGGAVVSELAPDIEPTRGTFPRRNRIISGLTAATVVVEAPARSGALITASWALEQGRHCFLVPGSLDAPASAGCLAFLREFEGEAHLVAGIPQLIADLGLAKSAPRPGVDPTAAAGPTGHPRGDAVTGAAVAVLGTTERSVAEALLAGNRTVDELVATTGHAVATVLATLTMLERRGLVAGRHGRYRPDGALLGEVALPRPR
ncbi:MAG: DNA-processing protein DprA [Chloroflexota bacterium]